MGHVHEDPASSLKFSTCDQCPQVKLGEAGLQFIYLVHEVFSKPVSCCLASTWVGDSEGGRGWENNFLQDRSWKGNPFFKQPTLTVFPNLVTPCVDCLKNKQSKTLGLKLLKFSIWNRKKNVILLVPNFEPLPDLCMLKVNWHSGTQSIPCLKLLQPCLGTVVRFFIISWTQSRSQRNWIQEKHRTPWWISEDTQSFYINWIMIFELWSHHLPERSLHSNR